MKQVLFAVGIFLFTSQFTYAQEIEISGQIVDKESKEAIPYVHIVNTSTGQGMVSNTEGRFWVTMDKFDTLQLSSIGFEKYAFTLKPNITTDKLIVTIELNTSTLELETVNVFAYRNEQALKKALLEMDVPIEQEETLKIPGVREAKKLAPPSGNGGISLGSPITMIAKAFSKEEKERKLLKKYQKEYEYQRVLTSKYNETIVMEITNIPEDKVEDFMEFCVLEDSFIYRATEYELAVVLNQCLIDFNKIEEDK